jgi:hypothetical protein
MGRLVDFVGRATAYEAAERVRDALLDPATVERLKVGGHTRTHGVRPGLKICRAVFQEQAFKSNRPCPNRKHGSAPCS